MTPPPKFTGMLLLMSVSEACQMFTGAWLSIDYHQLLSLYRKQPYTLLEIPTLTSLSYWPWIQLAIFCKIVSALDPSLGHFILRILCFSVMSHVMYTHTSYISACVVDKTLSTMVEIQLVVHCEVGSLLNLEQLQIHGKLQAYSFRYSKDITL